VTTASNRLGSLDREEQEGEPVRVDQAEAVLGKPDRVGQADDDALAGRDQRHGAEHRVAQPARARLHDIGEDGVAQTGAVILDDVGLGGRDHQADLAARRPAACAPRDIR
jgi:hypothetical protein